MTFLPDRASFAQSDFVSGGFLKLFCASNAVRRKRGGSRRLSFLLPEPIGCHLLFRNHRVGDVASAVLLQPSAFLGTFGNT